MIGEALAMVMGNTRVWSAGIYFDQNQFPNRTYFAPYAYKTQLNTRRFQVGSSKYSSSISLQLILICGTVQPLVHLGVFERG